MDVAIEEDFEGKKVAVDLFSRRSANGENSWVSIYQMEEVKNTLRAVFENSDENLVTYLKENEFQYSVG